MTRQAHGQAVAATAAAAVLWGTFGPLGALYPPGSQTGFAAVRLLSGAAVLALLGRSAPARSRWRRAELGLALVGGIAVAAYQPLYFAAVDSTGVAIATVVSIGLAPFITGLVRWACAGDRPRLRWWAAAAVAVAGIASLGLASGATRLDMRGLLLASAAAAAYGGQALTLGPLAVRHGAGRAAAAVFACGAVLVTPVLVTDDLSWLREPSLLVGVLYAGVMTLGLAYWLFTYGARTLGSPTAVMVSLLEPAVAALLAVAVLRERPTWTVLLGLGLVLLSVVLVLSGRPGRRSTSAAPPAAHLVADGTGRDDRMLAARADLSAARSPEPGSRTDRR